MGAEFFHCPQEDGADRKPQPALVPRYAKEVVLSGDSEGPKPLVPL